MPSYCCHSCASIAFPSSACTALIVELALAVLHCPGVGPGASEVTGPAAMGAPRPWSRDRRRHWSRERRDAMNAQQRERRRLARAGSAPKRRGRKPKVSGG
jgi:hypothetical protein